MSCPLPFSIATLCSLEPCFPRSYGHWAAKGLQIQDHTFGLDSGCVYSGSLTALIMDGGSSSIDELESNESLTQQVIQIGGREAQLVSLDCSA